MFAIVALKYQNVLIYYYPHYLDFLKLNQLQISTMSRYGSLFPGFRGSEWRSWVVCQHNPWIPGAIPQIVATAGGPLRAPLHWHQRPGSLPQTGSGPAQEIHWARATGVGRSQADSGQETRSQEWRQKQYLVPGYGSCWRRQKTRSG